jgi:hypothetical protein
MAIPLAVGAMRGCLPNGGHGQGFADARNDVSPYFGSINGDVGCRGGRPTPPDSKGSPPFRGGAARR